MSTIQ